MRIPVWGGKQILCFLFHCSESLKNKGLKSQFPISKTGFIIIKRNHDLSIKCVLHLSPAIYSLQPLYWVCQMSSRCGHAGIIMFYSKKFLAQPHSFLQRENCREKNNRNEFLKTINLQDFLLSDFYTNCHSYFTVVEMTKKFL